VHQDAERVINQSINQSYCFIANYDIIATNGAAPIKADKRHKALFKTPPEINTSIHIFIHHKIQQKLTEISTTAVKEKMQTVLLRNGISLPQTSLAGSLNMTDRQTILDT